MTRLVKEMPSLSPLDISLFWSHVEKTGTCWNWTGRYVATGYGAFGGRKYIRAHRLSWFLENGTDPSSMLVLHRCDNKRCVRPYHLFLGTHSDNVADKVNKHRQARGSSHGMYGRSLNGELNGFARLTWVAIKDIRTNYRRYERGQFTLKSFANKYGVAEGTISKIVRNEAWIDHDTR